MSRPWLIRIWASVQRTQSGGTALGRLLPKARVRWARPICHGAPGRIGRRDTSLLLTRHQSIRWGVTRGVI